MVAENATKTFNLLSIGRRGVGKTVFLAGSYAELHGNIQTERPQQLWFDCQDTQEQTNIEDILSYIVQSGQYPPPTTKIRNYNFSLKRHNLSGAQTLCHFRWWDIPGEICNMQNQDFRQIMSNSHGCCVFIDAYALVHTNTYVQALKDIIEQLVMVMVSLISLNGLKYAFALILTKCDLLEPGLLSQQRLKDGLQPLITRLDAVKANYQTFYSSIPIVHTESGSTLRPKGAAAPLLWLVLELSKDHNPDLMNNLLEWVTPLLPSRFQPGQDLADAMQSVIKPADKASKVKNSFGLYLLPSTRRSILLLALAIVGSVGIITSLFVDYKRFLQREPKNLDALENIATLKQRGQLNQAVSLMEKLVQQQPELLDLRLQLAQLYESTGQLTKAETAYDQVLTQQKDNLNALVGKAMLHYAQGDITTAAALFVQAEKTAPTDLKAQVRALAQKTLQAPAKPMMPGK